MGGKKEDHIQYLSVARNLIASDYNSYKCVADEIFHNMTEKQSSQVAIEAQVHIYQYNSTNININQIFLNIPKNLNQLQHCQTKTKLKEKQARKQK